MAATLRRRSWRLAVVALTGTTATALVAGCGGDSATPSKRDQPAPVALHASGAPSGLRIGVVVTLTSRPGEGADWSEASEGAQVAAFRYRLGGTDVTLTAVNDKGTPEGARAAVSQLAGDHVAGIVFATSGRHLDAGLAQAQSSGIASILPYPTDVALPADAWTIAPGAEQVGSGLSDRLTAIGASTPVVVDAGGPVPSGLKGIRVLHVASGGDGTGLAGKVAKLKRRNAADAVVISGDAAAEATVTAALQGAGVNLPVLLTPTALSPAFAAALDKAGGSLETTFTTVGVPSPDTTALTQGASGAAASAFLAALRTAAASPTLKDFFDAESFDTVAAGADSRSHDAVVALVTAAARAKSDDPAKVLAALKSLSLTNADGLAGPALDFGQQQALGDSGVTALESTAQGTELRPPSKQAQLFWFTAPRA